MIRPAILYHPVLLVEQLSALVAAQLHPLQLLVFPLVHLERTVSSRLVVLTLLLTERMKCVRPSSDALRYTGSTGRRQCLMSTT